MSAFGRLMSEKKPVLVIDKDLDKMSYMELRDAYKNGMYRQNEIIRQMARRLLALNRFSKPQIKDKIVEDLESVGVNDRYVRHVLGPEYTDQSKNSAGPKKEAREKAKAEPKTFGSVRSDTTIKMIIPDDLMDWIDDERGDDSPQKFIINKLKELAGLA